MDPIWWLAPLLTSIGILVSIVVALTRSLPPKLDVRFSCPNGDPAALDCEITNRGRGIAREVFVNFSRQLPEGTRLFASPDVRAELIEADAPPDPLLHPFVASLQRAFAVRIPRIARGQSIQFQVRTEDADNVRAAKQVVRVRAEIERVVYEFGLRLQAVDLQVAALWNSELILKGREKDGAFFHPLSVTDETGTRPISVLSEAEQLAAAHCQEIYKAFKATLIDVFQGRQSYKAPVVKFKTSSGARTTAIMPPYVETFVEMTVSRAQLAKGPVVVYPPIPESYD